MALDGFGFCATVRRTTVVSDDATRGDGERVAHVASERELLAHAQLGRLGNDWQRRWRTVRCLAAWLVRGSGREVVARAERGVMLGRVESVSVCMIEQ